MNEETRTFLASVFPETDAADLELFGDLFGGVMWGRDKTKAERDAEVKAFATAIEEIQSLPVNCEGMIKCFSVRKACRDLNYVPEAAESEAQNVDLKGIEAALNLRMEQKKTWFKCNPRPRGTDSRANGIAETVAYVFAQLDHSVTEGTRKVNGQYVPSTNFGKVVKYALEYHEVGADWISPHRTIARKWRDGWRP